MVWFGGLVWWFGLVVWFGDFVLWFGLVFWFVVLVLWFGSLVWFGGLVWWFGVVGARVLRLTSCRTDELRVDIGFFLSRPETIMTDV